MKRRSHITLLNNSFANNTISYLFTALRISLFIQLATPLSSNLYAAAERDHYPDQDLLASLSLSTPHHGFSQFHLPDGNNCNSDTLDLLGDGALEHDKSLLEKGWDWYYSLNPIAQKAAPTTRGMGTVWHYGQQLLAIGKRKAQKYGANSDEVAALKLGINIKWPNSTLHDQDRNRYLQEALCSISQIKQEYQTRLTTPLSHYVSERITDLVYFLAFTEDKSKSYYLRKRILTSLQQIHGQSNLLDFDIPKLNITGKELIPIYTARLQKEEADAGTTPGAQARVEHDGEHEEDLDISSASDGEDGGSGRNGRSHKHNQSERHGFDPEEKRQ